jgi:hypothetical protein
VAAIAAAQPKRKKPKTQVYRGPRKSKFDLWQYKVLRVISDHLQDFGAQSLPNFHEIAKICKLGQIKANVAIDLFYGRCRHCVA